MRRRPAIAVVVLSISFVGGCADFIDEGPRIAVFVDENGAVSPMFGSSSAVKRLIKSVDQYCETPRRFVVSPDGTSVAVMSTAGATEEPTTIFLWPDVRSPRQTICLPPATSVMYVGTTALQCSRHDGTSVTIWSPDGDSSEHALDEGIRCIVVTDDHSWFALNREGCVYFSATPISATHVHVASASLLHRDAKWLCGLGSGGAIICDGQTSWIHGADGDLDARIDGLPFWTWHDDRSPWFVSSMGMLITYQDGVQTETDEVAPGRQQWYQHTPMELTSDTRYGWMPRVPSELLLQPNKQVRGSSLNCAYIALLRLE